MEYLSIANRDILNPEVTGTRKRTAESSPHANTNSAEAFRLTDRKKAKTAHIVEGNKTAEDTASDSESRIVIVEDRPRVRRWINPRPKAPSPPPVGSVEFFKSRGINIPAEVINVQAVCGMLPRGIDHSDQSPETLVRTIIDLEDVEKFVKESLSNYRKALATLVKEKIDQQTEILDHLLPENERR